MRVCSGRKGSWEGLVIVRTVGHGQFQAVTHFHEQDHCSFRWRATPLSESPAQLNSSSSQKRTKLEGAEETLCKVAKLPNTSIEVLEISTKVTFFFFKFQVHHPLSPPPHPPPASSVNRGVSVAYSIRLAPLSGTQRGSPSLTSAIWVLFPLGRGSPSSDLMLWEKNGLEIRQARSLISVPLFTCCVFVQVT